ncbi:MAG: glycosyltransferase family 4 protein [Cyanobacteria bacterium J06636_16]
MRIGYLHIGPFRHGIHRYGYLLAQAASQREDLDVIEASVCLDEDKSKNHKLLIEAAQKLSKADIVHIQFSKFGKQLWGEGWSQLQHLRLFFKYCAAPVVVTLHDVYYPPSRLTGVIRSATAKLNRKVAKPSQKQLNTDGVSKQEKTQRNSNQVAKPKRSAVTKGFNFVRTIIKGVVGPDALALREIARRTHKVIVCTQEEQRRIRDRVQSPKLTIIPHFVETRTISTTTEEARKTLELEGVKVITLLGFIYPPKGHQLLVEAMPNLPEEVRVIFAGGPSSASYETFVQDLQDIAKTSGVDNRLRITGYLSEADMECYLKATDIAVCPFSRISASGSLSTWISVACPILASESPQIEELGQLEPEAIKTFSPYTSAALAEAIKDQLSQPQDDAQAAVKRLRQKLLIPTILNQHVTVYRRVTNL